MNRIKQFAYKSPIGFGFVITLLFILLVIISSVMGNIWSSEPAGQYIGRTLGRIISIIILMTLVSGLGWLTSAGFTRLGHWPSWLISALPLVYAITVSAFAMSGNFDFGITDLKLTGVVALFIMIAAFNEEIAFRGLVMQACVRAWAGRDNGLILSVLVSSLFFAGMHSVNILANEPALEVLLQCLVAFLLGIFLGALVLFSKSIYPATVFHGLLNFTGYLNLTANDIDGTGSSWLLLGGLLIPLAIFGLILLQRVTRRPLILDAA